MIVIYASLFIVIFDFFHKYFVVFSIQVLYVFN